MTTYQQCNCDNCTPCTCIHQDFLIGCESVSIDLAGRCPGPVYGVPGVHGIKISKIPSSNNEMQKLTCPKSIQCRFKGVGLFEWSFDHGSPTKDPKYNRQPLTVTNMQGSQVSFFATSWTLPLMSTNLPFEWSKHEQTFGKSAAMWHRVKKLQRNDEWWGPTPAHRTTQNHTETTQTAPSAKEGQGVPCYASLWPYPGLIILCPGWGLKAQPSVSVENAESFQHEEHVGVHVKQWSEEMAGTCCKPFLVGTMAKWSVTFLSSKIFFPTSDTSHLHTFATIQLRTRRCFLGLKQASAS